MTLQKKREVKFSLFFLETKGKTFRKNKNNLDKQKVRHLETKRIFFTLQKILQQKQKVRPSSFSKKILTITRNSIWCVSFNNEHQTNQTNDY